MHHHATTCKQMNTASFYVIYQFKVKPDQEETFKNSWRRLTDAIREQRGGLGSRLHKAGEEWWLAYAQWPDRATWEAAQQRSDSPDREASELMAHSIEESKAPIPLEKEIDMLEVL